MDIAGGVVREQAPSNNTNANRLASREMHDLINIDRFTATQPSPCTVRSGAAVDAVVMKRCGVRFGHVASASAQGAGNPLRAQSFDRKAPPALPQGAVAP